MGSPPDPALDTQAGEEGGDAEAVAAWFEPLYDIDTTETAVWSGHGQLTGQPAPRPTDLAVRWKPTIDIIFRQSASRGEDGTVWAQLHDGFTLRLTDHGREAPALLLTPTPPTGSVPVLQWGDASAVRRLRFHAANFLNLHLREPVSDGKTEWPGGITVTAGPWQLELHARPDLAAVSERLRADGGYAVTHTGELRRLDGAVLNDDGWQDALRCVQSLLTFARGAWVAPMLPVGFDESGATVWREAGARFCTGGWGRGINWLSVGDPDAFAEVTKAWMRMWNDGLWHDVLYRAAAYHAEANRQGLSDPSFIETRIVMGAAGLELLAWAILHEDPTVTTTAKWRDGGPGAAAENLRALLAWAGLKPAIPPELEKLAAYAVADSDELDVAALVPRLRNPLAHPRRRNGRLAPPGEVLVEGWQLVTWLLELVLLRRLGFSGRYMSRLRPGRWETDTEQVPWHT